MKYCMFCGQKLLEQATFCSKCGKKQVVETIISEATCPYCQSKITSAEKFVACPVCKIPHHQECWNENHGCTTFGCVQKNTDSADKNRITQSDGGSELSSAKSSYSQTFWPMQSTSYVPEKTGFSAKKPLIWSVAILAVVVIAVAIGLNSFGKTDNSETGTQRTRSEQRTDPVSTENEKVLSELNSFYQDISNSNYRSAYSHFSPAWQAKTLYDGWVAGFATTVSNNLIESNVRGTLDSNSTTAFVDFKLRARDRKDGQILIQVFQGCWIMKKIDGSWKIDDVDGNIKVIEKRYE